MKRIVIIGASSGIGEQVARDFAAIGWRVGIAARREEPLKKIQQDFPLLVEYSIIDVTTPDAVERFYDLIEKIDGMDILLYASGVGSMNPKLDIQTDLDTVDVNVAGFTRIVDAAYRYFQNTANVEPGRIAVISSIAGTKGIGVAASYSASKRYQWTYIDALEQLARQERVNVKFTDIRPGFIDTPLLAGTRKFPMIMPLRQAALLIEKAIVRGNRRIIIDSKWRVVGALWRAIPKCLWRNLTIK